MPRRRSRWLGSLQKLCQLRHGMLLDIANSGNVLVCIASLSLQNRPSKDALPAMQPTSNFKLRHYPTSEARPPLYLPARRGIRLGDHGWRIDLSSAMGPYLEP